MFFFLQAVKILFFLNENLLNLFEIKKLNENVILTILHEFKYILEIMIMELYILQFLSPARICVALH